MKIAHRFLSSALLIAFTFVCGCSQVADKPATEQVLYPVESQKSFIGSKEFFTGNVEVKLLFPKNVQTSFSGAYVTFQPGARTAWHLHPAGQHIVVTDGVCLTGTRDGKIITCKTGESVWCPIGIDHWHGAPPDQAMTHLVITGSKNDQNVIWKEKVSDEQYLGSRPK